MRARAATLIASALMLGACAGSPAPHGQREARQTQLQQSLAAQIRGLLDSDGLVMDPPTYAGRPPGLYASALLLGAAGDLGVEGVTQPHLDEVAVADLVADASAQDVPAQWQAWSLTTLGADLPASLSAQLSGPDLEILATDPDLPTRVVNLRILAVVHSRAASGELPVVRRHLESIRGEGPELADVAWNLREACRLAQARCVEPVVAAPPASYDSPSDLLTIQAAARLAASGAPVARFDLASAAEQARRTLDAMPDGNELVASALGTIAKLGTGSARSFSDYLDRATQRRDPRTGLYRAFVDFRGNVGATYAALLVTGPAFAAAVDPDRTPATLTARGRAGQLGDDVAKAQAAVILQVLGAPVPDRLVGEVDRIRAGLGGAEIQPEQAGRAAELLSVLRNVASDVPRPHLTPFPVTQPHEAAVVEVLAQAFDGALANSSDVIAYYADYLAALPRTLARTDADDPAFVPRLTLIDYVADDLTDRERTTILSRLDTRLGCTAAPGLVLTSSGTDARCSIAVTADVVNSSIGASAVEGQA